MATGARERPGRVEVGGLLAGLGAVLLAIALFIDWFEPGVTAWTVFEALDLVLAACAVAGLAFAARSFGFPTIGARAAGAAATVALVVVVSQLINHPPVVLEADIETGAWLALAGAVLMFLGALMSLTGVSLAVDREHHGGAAPATDPSRAAPPGTPSTREPEPVPPSATAPGEAPPPGPAGAPGGAGTTPPAPPAPGPSEQTTPLPPREPPR